MRLLETWMQRGISTRLLGAAFVVLLCWTLTELLFLGPKRKALENEASKGAARAEGTWIPLGHRLVPIEFRNQSSMQNFLAEEAWIDLYSTRADGRKGHRVLEQVRVLRAPLAPEHFGILIPEEQMPIFQNDAGPFWAVLTPTREPEAKDNAGTPSQKGKKLGSKSFSSSAGEIQYGD